MRVVCNDPGFFLILPSSASCDLQIEECPVTEIYYLMFRHLTGMRFRRLALAFLALFGLGFYPASAQPLKLAVTTTFEDSGLSSVLLPAFSKDTGIKVHLIVVGTGRALRLGADGDVDAVLVHSTKAELKFVADGYARARHDVMYNDFVLVGPADDPLRLGGMKTAREAFQQISEGKALFVSRGDDSGTHKKELALWKLAGIAIGDVRGAWYRAAGTGMGATLNITAAAANAYTMSDRGTWLHFRNKRALKILFHGDPALRNQYGLLIVNPDRHPHVQISAAEAFRDWVTSKRGQSLIGAYKIAGERAFIPNATKK